MRKKYIDLLRMIALFYMFFQHSVLALLKQNSNNGIIFFLYEIVPLCPALFLFICGFSISMSLEKNANLDKNKFNIHLLKRSLILIFLSSLIFLIEYGIQLPDLVISSSILNTIGLMILLSMIFINLPIKEILLTIFIVLLTLIYFILDLNKILIYPFNDGYEPIVPTVIFGFAGLLIGLVINKFKNNNHSVKKFVTGIGAIGLLITVFYFHKFGAFKVLFTDIGRYEITRVFNESNLLINLFKNNNDFPLLFPVTLWNYKFNCFLASLGIVFVLFASGFFLENFLTKYLSEKIFLPGKFAFANYFFHLSVISLLVVFSGYNFLSAEFLLLFMLSLLFSSYFLSFILNSRKFFKKSPGHLSGV